MAWIAVAGLGLTACPALASGAGTVRSVEFGAANYAVLAAYLVVLVLMGAYFA
ncbi:hypothetical protein LCGC14_2225020, partial [marine sediment metagenome]